MSATTRVNGSGQFTTGTLFSVYQMKVFLIDTGADISAQDGPAADEALEAVVREVQPLMYYNAVDKLHVVVDGHAVDAATLQLRIRQLGTVNGYDFSGATVTLGTSITVA